MAFNINQNWLYTSALLVFILSVGEISIIASRKLQEETSLIERHEQWIVKYGKVYKDNKEKERRFKIFKDNFEFIESFNAVGNKPYRLSINQFGDQTNEEFKIYRNGYKRSSKPSSVHMSSTKDTSAENVTTTTLPSSMDWRKKGAVTPIKDQGQCGSCWAFSAVAATEGIIKLKTGKPISLSEQELLDCDVKGEDQGCEGGQMEGAFKFIINNGINSEAKYSYKGKNGTCNRKEEESYVAKIKGYKIVPVNNEKALLKAVVSQQISVSIDGGGSAFQFYSSGVFTGDCGTDLDHGVTAIGHGITEDGLKYWLVKNSWGTEWGEKGYIRMLRDIHDKRGLCGIAMDASYPIA